MSALRTIQNELERLADEADDDHPIDPHTVRIMARKVAAQAEMIEQGLVE